MRDLLLGRTPKDFDIGTSAHPYQVKRLFRNCWIIGRRFRLAHVKFGPKVIEVATFRRQVPAGTEEEPVARRLRCRRRRRGGRRSGSADPSRQHVRHARRGRVPARLHAERAVLRHRDAFDHRLRRRPRRHPRRASSGASAFRKSGFRKTRSGCCARSRWPRGSTSRSTRPFSQAIDRYHGELARSAPPV